MSGGGRPRFDDSWLYADDCIDINLMLFGGRVCKACGRRLPASSDYFTRDVRVVLQDTFKPNCKRCTRERYRGADKARRQAGRDAAKAARRTP